MDPLEQTVEILMASKDVTKDCRDGKDKARAIHQYVSTQILDGGNVQEGRGFTRKFIRPYQTAAQTFDLKKGGCLEAAFLYVAMARSAGIDARVARLDVKGGSLAHAAAVVYLPTGRVYVDATSKSGFGEIPETVGGYDVVKFKVMTDDEARGEFRYWNAKPRREMMLNCVGAAGVALMVWGAWYWHATSSQRPNPPGVVQDK